MGKIAFIFPGQGAQSVGMGREIAENFASASAIFDQASEALGFDVREMVFSGDEETLKITENTQPTILTTSIACLQPLLEKGIRPDFVAGLSLGEYSAHVAAGSMNFADAVRLVRKRGKFMQEAVPVGVGTMAAVLGLENEDVVACCTEASVSGTVEPANFNCPGQVVVAGEIAAVEKVVELAKSKGAKRSMILPVSAPFHCSMLRPAGEKLEGELSGVQISETTVPLISNVTADIAGSPEEIRTLLVNQVSSSVLWEASVRKLLDLGVDTFVEVGPGKALSGFVKKVSKEVRILNIEDLASLEKTLAELGA